MAAGFESTVVCGRVRSTATVSMSLVVFRALSVATTLSVHEPSAGIARETEYGTVVSTPIESCEPQAGVGHSKNSTCVMSASGLEAVTVKGSAAEALTIPTGAVMSIAGALLSTRRSSTTAEVVELPALSTAITRRS